MTTLMGGRPRYDLMFPQADHVDVDKLVTALLVKDSFEGHHVVGTPDTYKHGWVKIGVGVDSSHLSLKKNGDVVHKPTGTVIGHVDKKTDFPTKGTSTFVTSHANGKQVYGGVYKKDAMAAVARYHNHAATTETQAQQIANNVMGNKKPNLGDLPEGSKPVMLGFHVTGYTAPNGDLYDTKGHLQVSMSGSTKPLHVEPEPSHVEPEVAKPDLIPGSNVPTALTGQSAYDHAQASQGSLNPTQLNAVANYGKPSGYKVVNPYLNKDGMVFDSGSMKYKPASENQIKTAKTMIKHLDAAIVAGKPTTQDLVVHRRLGNSINDLIGPPGSHVGKTFINKAYVSTTTANAGIPGNGYGYENKKTLMDIRVPKGSKVLMGQAAEKEVILPRGAKFTVVDDQVEADGTRHVKVLYHPDQSESSDLPKPATLKKPEVKPPVPALSTPSAPPKSLDAIAEEVNNTSAINYDEGKKYPTSVTDPLYSAVHPIATHDPVNGLFHLQIADQHLKDALDDGKVDQNDFDHLHGIISNHVADLQAHLAESKPATSSVPLPGASASSDQEMAKQLSDQAVGMEDNLSPSMHLPLAVQSTLSSAAAMSGGKKSTALTHLALASAHLNNHAKVEPDDAVLAAAYQHSLAQIENKIKDSDSSSGDTAASNTIKDVAGKIDTELTDSTHTSHAYDSTFDAWAALKQGDLQGAVGHLNAAQVHLTHHVNTHATDFVKGMGLYQKLEHVKSSLQGAVVPNIPASAKPSISAEPVHVPSSPMIDSTDLSMKTNGDVVHKQTKQVIGHVVKYKNVPSKGTTTFVVSHNDGTKVYQGPYKGKSLAALAQHHNTKGTGAAQQLLNAQKPKAQPKAKPVVNEGYHGNIKLNLDEKAGVPGVRASIDHPVLSAPEMSAARLYSGSEYRDMNKYIAAGYTFGDSFTYHTADDKKTIKDAVDALKPAVDRSVVKKPFAVVRRVPGYAAMETFGLIGSHVGKTYKENRFVSTTTNAKGISSFGETEIHYHMKPGAKALDLNKHDASLHKNEKEILLGPGQTFKILNDSMVGKNRIIVVESQ